MKAGALSKVERVNQVWLDEAMASHQAYLVGKRGGHRLFLGFKDAQHLQFGGHDLASVEMVAGLFAQACFAGTTLTRGDLFGANFERADMQSADLTRADLRGANLAGANLENAVLREADFRNGFILVQDKDGGLVPVRDGASNISDVNFAGADLSGARLNRVIGSRTNLANAKVI